MTKKTEKEGQRKSLQELDEALRDAALSSEVKRLLRSRLLPKTKPHAAAPRRPRPKADR